MKSHQQCRSHRKGKSVYLNIDSRLIKKKNDPLVFGNIEKRNMSIIFKCQVTNLKIMKLGDHHFLTIIQFGFKFSDHTCFTSLDA